VPGSPIILATLTFLREIPHTFVFPIVDLLVLLVALFGRERIDDDGCRAGVGLENLSFHSNRRRHILPAINSLARLEPYLARIWYASSPDILDIVFRAARDGRIVRARNRMPAVKAGAKAVILPDGVMRSKSRVRKVQELR
jgi:hypothetical protein